MKKFLQTKLGSPRTLQACKELGIEPGIFSEKIRLSYHGPKGLKEEILSVRRSHMEERNRSNLIRQN